MSEQEILVFTEAASERIRTFIAEDPAEGLAVRVSIQNASPIAPEYEMALIEPFERESEDESFDAAGFEVIVDSRSAALLAGTRVDWVESLQGSGFHFRNPNIQPLGSGSLDGPLVDRVRRVIDEQINPGVASHGGTVHLVEIRDNVVYVTMGGGCQGCGMASVTLTQGIKQMIKDAAPEIVDVQDVTDHAAGDNPYYA
ncbi:iron-sulfur cluster assembly accessory protein [Candidatus Palauibacter sp.]|uniref:iron-sulfur cluster assembly accessory protein n=1 Tax=Candidatus Palauibacter sp. TaxID=3101350 RepID=UPI003B5C9A23